MKISSICRTKIATRSLVALSTFVLIIASIYIFGFSSPVQAVVEPGLAVTIYDNYGYNQSPPLPTVSGRPVQCTTTYLSINQDFGGNICGLYDDFIVKYEGYITSPTTETITFYPSADDGTKLYIDDVLVDNNWRDKGGGGNSSTPINFVAGVPKPITLWFYENGGSNWVQLSWSQGDSYSIVPTEAFTQNSETSYTTTTTSTSTTTTTTTTTISPTTTTTVAPYFNAVQNLTAVANENGSVALDWDAPQASNTAPYMYSVSFYDLIEGVESGGWGIWTYAANTAITLDTGMFSGSNPVTTGYGPVRFKIKAGTGPCVGEGQGSCLYGPEASVDATVLDPTPPTTTSTTTTTTSTTTTSTSTTTSTTTTTVPTTTTVYEPPVVVVPPVDNGTTSTSTVPVVVIPPVDTTVPLPEVDKPGPVATLPTLPVETKPQIVLPTITVPEDEDKNPWISPIGAPKEFDKLPDNATSTQIGAVIEDVDFTGVTDKNFDKTVDAVFDNINKPEDVANVIGAFLEADVSSKQLDAVLDKVFDGPMTANETTKILEGLLDGPVTATQLETIMDKVFEDISDTKNTIAVLGALLDGPLSKQELGSVMEAVFSEEATVTQMSAVVGDLLNQKLDVKELDAVFKAAFDGDLSDKETIDLIVDVLAEDLTSEALGSALGAVFDDEVSNEVLVETFTAVLGNEINKESLGVIVNVLESESISEAQVATVVTLIIEQEGGVDSEQATELATSPKVLESISGEQASEVFDAVIVAEVSEEAGIEIAAALTEASTDVKESFEEEINVFAGVFDTYTALGSTIDVGTRRTVIAVAALSQVVAVAATGITPTSGNMGRESSSSPNPNDAVRREEEEEQEASEVEGIDLRPWLDTISIWIYVNGIRKFSMKKFLQKFWYETLSLGFTLSSSIVLWVTLSGFTRNVAIVATVLAFAAHYYLVMWKQQQGSDE